MNVKRMIVLTVALLMAVPVGMMPAYAADGAQPSVVVSDRGASTMTPPSAEVMTADALLVRPLGIVATVAGAGLFVISLPFSAIGGNVGQAAEALVVAPAKMTFARPLGQFHH